MTSKQATKAEAQGLLSKGVLSVKVVDNKPGAIAGILASPQLAIENKEHKTSQTPWVEWFDSDIEFTANALQRLRLSTAHSRIVFDKTGFITGRGLTVSGTDAEIKAFTEYAETVNAAGEHLDDVKEKIDLDCASLGNAFLELVRMPIKGTKQNRVNLIHKDASYCKVAKVNEAGEIPGVYYTRDWTQARIDKKAPLIPMYPNWGKVEGFEGERCIIHFKKYYPGYFYYGLPDYISAYYSGWLDIDYHIPSYNLTRFKNQFRPSGLLVLVGRNLTPAQAEEIEEDIEKNYAGENQNSKLIIATVNDETVAPKYMPFDDAPDGAFVELQNLANENIIKAHRWHPSLVLQTPGKMSNASDIRAAFEMVSNTVVEPEQLRTCRTLSMVLKNEVGLNFEKLSVIPTKPVSLADQLDPKTILTVDEQREELGRAAATDEQRNELVKAATDVKQNMPNNQPVKKEGE